MSKRTRSELLKDLAAVLGAAASVVKPFKEVMGQSWHTALAQLNQEKTVRDMMIIPPTLTAHVPGKPTTLPITQTVRLEYRNDSTNPMKNAKVGDHIYGKHEDDFGATIDFGMSKVQVGTVYRAFSTLRDHKPVHVKIVDYDASDPLEKCQAVMCHNVIVNVGRFKVGEVINGPVESDFDDAYIAEFTHGIVYRVGPITFEDKPAADRVEIHELTPDQYAREQANREDIIITHDDSEEAHMMTAAVWDSMMEMSLHDQVAQLTVILTGRTHMDACSDSQVEREVHLKWVDFFDALILAKTLELALETAAEYLGGNHGTS